jgi:hypothetical protein
VVLLTDRAREAVGASLAAARRFDPKVRLRVIRQDGRIRLVFAARTEPGDQLVDVDGIAIGVDPAIDGTLDAHDHNELRLVGP